jgi:PSP1 C-terminal conserved region
VGARSYLIRYGVMSHVGRFPILAVHDTTFERGQLVVLQTERGLELGEVLIAVDSQTAPADRAPGVRADVDHSSPQVTGNAPHVLRVASPDDLLSSKHAQEMRPSRFSLCQRVLEDGNWPWELIDVEPLLDGRSTVIHYLGPHRIDVSSLRARFRVECDLDVVLEPVGSDPDCDVPDGLADEEEESGEGCGTCGCSSGGGCGTTTVPEHAGHGHHRAEPAASGCATKPHSGCSSCGVSKILADRNRSQA